MGEEREGTGRAGPRSLRFEMVSLIAARSADTVLPAGIHTV